MLKFASGASAWPAVTGKTGPVCMTMSSIDVNGVCRVRQLRWHARPTSGSATARSVSRRDGAATAALTAPICRTSSAVPRITLPPTTSVISAASSGAAARASAFTTRGSATRIPTVKTALTKPTVSGVCLVHWVGAFGTVTSVIYTRLVSVYCSICLSFVVTSPPHHERFNCHFPCESELAGLSWVGWFAVRASALSRREPFGTRGTGFYEPDVKALKETDLNQWPGLFICISTHWTIKNVTFYFWL